MTHRCFSPPLFFWLGAATQWHARFSPSGTPSGAQHAVGQACQRSYAPTNTQQPELLINNVYAEIAGGGPCLADAPHDDYAEPLNVVTMAAYSPMSESAYEYDVGAGAANAERKVRQPFHF